MVSTLTTLFERSGATPGEARCLGLIAGRGAHSMLEAARGGTPAATAAARRCVPSSTRYQKIGDGLIATIARIDPQFLQSAGPAESCGGTASDAIVPISGTSGTTPPNWQTMTPQQLRKAGWRRVSATSTSFCQPGP
jgi:hypothetical protein